MIYTFEDFQLDTDLYELRRNGRRIPVEPQVFDVVLYLVRQRDRVVPKEELFENVWKTKFVTESALTSRIKAARRALGDAGREQRLIGTVHGRGYRFLGVVEELDPTTPQRNGPPSRALPEGSPASGVMVGREHELHRLEVLLAEAMTGRRKMAVLTGEAGIGKSTTIHAFLDYARTQDRLLVASGQCLEHQGMSEPYMPLFNAMDQLCRSNPELDLLKTVARCGPNWLLEMPWLVDDEELAKLALRTVGNTRLRMLRELVETFYAIAEIRPLLLVLEDLQWSDPSTLDALNALVRSPVAARVMILCSCRASELADPRSRTAAMLQSLELNGLCEELAVPPLTAEQVGEYLFKRLPGLALPEGSDEFLHERTDGNPLFLKILVNDYATEDVAERDSDLPASGRLPTRVPETLRRMIEQHLAGMGPREQEVLEVAAVAGIETSPALIARAIEASDEEIEAVCHRLARSEQFLRRNELADGSITSADFAFAHGLYQEVIYDQMTSGRRARLHGAIGGALLASYGSRAVERAAELAFHFDLAGAAEPAVRYLQVAAGQALRRYAYEEATNLLESALRLVEALEPEERVESEIVLRDMHALTLIMVHGWSFPPAELSLKKALELSETLGNPDRQSLVLYHLAAAYENRGEHDKSKEVLEHRLRLQPSFTDSTSLLESHELLACSLFHKGEFADSLAHADKGWELYDPERHLALIAAALGENLGVSCHSWAALDLWYLGDPEGAERRMAVALQLAQDPAHQYCLGRAEERAAILDQLLGNPEKVLERTAASIDLGTEQGHDVAVATGHILRGWARTALGEVEGGPQELRSGLEAYEAAGSRIGLPYFLSLLADASLRASNPKEAVAATDEALRLIGERGFSHESELHRLRGLALGQLGRVEMALASLRRAVEIARGQKARSLENMAAASLAEYVAHADEASASRG